MEILGQLLVWAGRPDTVQGMASIFTVITLLFAVALLVYVARLRGRLAFAEARFDAATDLLADADDRADHAEAQLEVLRGRLAFAGAFTLSTAADHAEARVEVLERQLAELLPWARRGTQAVLRSRRALAERGWADDEGTDLVPSAASAWELLGRIRAGEFGEVRSDG